jgi:glycosyltransferase involved in cell wall biosynthesis
LLEVIVVDGDSDDDTPDIVEEIAHFDPRVKLLRNPNRTVPYAMNIGIRGSRGQVIVRVDAHARYPESYIRQSVHTLLATGADNVGGLWRTNPGARTPIARAIAMALTHPFGVGNASFRTGARAGFVDTVPFGSFRRSVFCDVGLFHERLTRHQDYELNTRIRRSGGRIYLEAGLSCDYYARPTLWSLLNQKFADGKWCVYSWVVCPEAYALRHAFPGVVTASALLLGAASLLAPVALSILLFCVAAYAFLAGLATLELALTRKSWSALLCPLVFPVLHFGHGMGVIAGVTTGRAWAKRTRAYEPAPALPVSDERYEETAA